MLAPPRKTGRQYVNLRDVLAEAQGDNVLDAAPSFADWLLDNRDPNTGERQRGDGVFDYRNLTPNQGREIYHRGGRGYNEMNLANRHRPSWPAWTSCGTPQAIRFIVPGE